MSPVASRAAASATRVDVEAVSVIIPNQSPGRPIALAYHCITTCSSSVHAGDVFHNMPLTLTLLLTRSARIPAPDGVSPKYAMNPGWFQCVIPGTMSLSRSLSI